MCIVLKIYIFLFEKQLIKWYFFKKLDINYFFVKKEKEKKKLDILNSTEEVILLDLHQIFRISVDKRNYTKCKKLCNCL